MSEEIPPSNPTRIFEILNRHGVDYVVIGGIAVIAHGHIRTTADVDFVADTEFGNLERLAAALRDLHAELRGVDAHLLDVDIYDPHTLATGANFTMTSEAGHLDFFNEIPGGLPYDRLRERAMVAEVRGARIVIAGFEDLIRMKIAADRPQDHADIAALRDAARASKHHDRGASRR